MTHEPQYNKIDERKSLEDKDCKSQRQLENNQDRKGTSRLRLMGIEWLLIVEN